MATEHVEVIPLKDQKPPSLDKERLVKFFLRTLYIIPSKYQSQDPNRLTLLYFTISGLDILGALDKVENKARIIDWIYSLQVLPSVDQTGAIDIPMTILRRIHLLWSCLIAIQVQFAASSFGFTNRIRFLCLISKLTPLCLVILAEESGQWGFRGGTFFGNPYDPSGKVRDSHQDKFAVLRA